VAMGHRMERVEDAIGPALCAHAAPCDMVTTSEVRLMPDGSEERIGTEPRPLCGGCPEKESSRPRVRHVEVVLDHRGLHKGEASEVVPRRATLPSVGPDGGEGR
jgi:hypothetical protein